MLSQTFNFRQYNEDQGLKSLYIYSISQAKNGYLYLSTSDGLVYYDGLNFKLLNKKNGLNENFVNTHYCANNGNIWLGHLQEGVSLLNKGKTIKINLPDYNNSRVNKIIESKGSIFINTSNDGIYKITNALTTLKIKGITSNQINDILLFGDTLYCATSENVEVYKLGTTQATKLFEIPNSQNKFYTKLINFNNNIMLCTQDDGLELFEKSKKLCKTILSKQQAGVIKSIILDKQNFIWIASENAEVKKLNYSLVDEELKIIQEYGQLQGLHEKNITFIFEDLENNIWLGSYGSGLYQLNEQSFTYQNYSDIGFDKQITCVEEVFKNNFLLGTNSGLYFASSLSLNKTIESFKTKTLNKLFITCLHKDKRNNFWVGTQNNGLFVKFNGQSEFINISKSISQEKNSEITSIASCDSNNVYIGTSFGLLTYSFDKNKLTLTTTNEGLTHNNIKFLFIDKSKKIWFATHGATLFNYKNGEFTVLKNINELKSFKLNGICQDKQGAIWFCTEGDGVFRIKDGAIKNYNLGKGLGSSFCYGISNDSKNNIWVIHKNKFSLLKNEDSLFNSITLPKSFQNSNNQPQPTITQAENLYFLNSQALLQFNLKNIKKNTIAPVLSINAIYLNDNLTPPENLKNLSYNNYKLKVEFAGINLAYPDKIKYFYKLEGYDYDWNELKFDQRSVSFPSIADGNYNFLLKACNNDFVFNEFPLSIKIKIQKPFWKSIWFYTLAFVVLVIIVLIIIRFRTQQLELQKNKLTQLVNLQTLELKTKYDELNKAKKVIEEINQDFTDSVTYAQRIQEAVLPTKAITEAFLNKLLIFYKPRDIVSGDFYWYGLKNNKFIVAVCDCTGHGVPGAFMSLIGGSILNKIVFDRGITEPSQILFELDNEVVSSINKNNRNVNDGMEMGLICFDFEERKLYFAGARRPLVYFNRNTNNQMQLNEIKGDIYPIGGLQGIFDSTKEFTTKSIEIEKESMLYMFSDGITDQFNDGNKKRISTKRFKEFLSEIVEFPITEQEMLLNSFFSSWKGNNNQTDDVLVLGIRI